VSTAARLLVACLVLALGAIGLYVIGQTSTSGSEQASGFTVPELDVHPGQAAPRGQAQGAGLPAPNAAAALARWSAGVSERTDIPRRALHSYALAELRLRKLAPGCRLSWTTLAGVGRAESQHGQHEGGTLEADGRPSRPIVGPVLNGSSGVKALRDTDNGRLDEDRRWDRAVGPMQFLPATWAKWSVRASGDGRPADPQSLDDAALTAGRYMCSAGGDLATPSGWWRAVLSYNASADYGRVVFSGADAYAHASAQRS
jgi:membrane-bound lytic murein transglycosylase B